MKRNRCQQNPQGLETLASQAKHYALHMMRSTGSVPPTVIADTDEGFIFCMPTELTDNASKDRFAEVTRLFAIAQHARSLVMVVEAWARLPDANGHLDTATPPSQAPDRKEVVVLMLKTIPATPPSCSPSSVTKSALSPASATRVPCSSANRWGAFQASCHETNPACARPPKPKPRCWAWE